MIKVFQTTIIIQHQPLQAATTVVSIVKKIIVFHGCGYVMTTQTAVRAMMRLRTCAITKARVEATSQSHREYLLHLHILTVTHMIWTVFTPYHNSQALSSS